nr:plus gametic plasma membrane protein homolog [Pleodorina starrii]
MSLLGVMVAIAVMPFVTVIAQNCAKFGLTSNATIRPLSSAVAGRPFTFEVKFVHPEMQQSCIYEPLLAVQCVNEANASFCQAEPSIRPIGDGIYLVTIVPTNLGASHQPWPPQLTPAQMLDSTFFLGSTSIHVKYDGRHVNGSPFPIQVRPGNFCPACSVINMLDQTSGTAGAEFRVARFYQITDNFTNWIRRLDIIKRLRAQTSSPVVTIELSWFANWWIDISVNSTRAGMYTFHLFYAKPDGSEELIPVHTAAGMDYVGSFEILPGPLNLPAEVVAGTTVTITLQAFDRFGNPTQLIEPIKNLPHLQQGYNMPTIQVVVQSPNQTVLPHPTEGLANVKSGLVTWNVPCYLAGSYQVLILFHASTSVVLFNRSFDVYPAEPSPRNTMLIAPTYAEAGMVNVAISLVDEWNNTPLSPLNTLLRVMAFHSNTSNTAISMSGPAQSDDTRLLVFNATFSLAGEYKVMSYLNNIFLKEATLFILPQKQPSLIRSGVIGYGAGAPWAVGSMTHPTRLTAGRTYTFWVRLQDRYGNYMDLTYINLHDMVSVLVDGPDNIVMSEGMRYFPMGMVEYTYSAKHTGYYKLSILVAGEVLHQGLLEVLPSALQPSATMTSVSSFIKAGSSIQVNVTFYDAHDNEIPVTGRLSVLLKSYDGKGKLAKDIQLIEDSHTSLAVALSSSGLYAGRCYLNNTFLGEQVFFSEVLPSSPTRVTFTPQDIASIHVISVDMTLWDMFGNAMDSPSVMSNLTLVVRPPEASWEANISFRSSKYQLTVWSGFMPNRSLSIAHHGSDIGIYQWSMHQTSPGNETKEVIHSEELLPPQPSQPPPPPRPPQPDKTEIGANNVDEAQSEETKNEDNNYITENEHKVSRRILKRVTIVCSATLLGSSIICFMTALLFLWMARL